MFNFVISNIFICVLLFSSPSYTKPPKVFISDLETLGEFSEIQNFPNKMFEGTNNVTFKQKAATAGKKMSYYFITKKKSLEKYPHNMMKAMGYFEVYYMQTLEDKKFNLTRFKDNDYNSNDIKNINTLLSLNKARKSRYKNAMKKMNLLIDNKKKSEALKFLPKLNSELMKIAKTGIIKKQNASRNVSRISKKIASI